MRRGVDGALRIVGPHDDHCVPRAGALRAAQKAGYDVVFVSGVRKDGGHLRGHAWVLVDDRPWSAPGRRMPRRTASSSGSGREMCGAVTPAEC